MKDVSIIIHSYKLEISEYSRKVLREAVKENGSALRGCISLITPESSIQRRYLMGGLIPLMCYLDGNDYRDSEVLKYYFEFLKKEFQPHALNIQGKIHVVGKSTKGHKALTKFIESVQDYLNEHYGISHDSKAISPEFYKEFRDKIYPFSHEYDDFIHYLVKMNIIK